MDGGVGAGLSKGRGVDEAAGVKRRPSVTAAAGAGQQASRSRLAPGALCLGAGADAAVRGRHVPPACAGAGCCPRMAVGAGARLRCTANGGEGLQTGGRGHCGLVCVGATAALGSLGVLPPPGHGAGGGGASGSTSSSGRGGAGGCA